MTLSDLKIAVVGLGHFGRFHAQKWAKTQGAQLAALVDRDVARARTLADELGGDIAVYGRVEDLPADIVAASVAVPTLHHAAVAQALIAQGRHVLIEKPLAATLEEADALIDAAAKAGVVLQVGHQERFFVERAPLDSRLVPPMVLTARRMGVPSGREMDCGVVLDLMIHDLDLMLWLTGAGPQVVASRGWREGHVHVERAEVDLAFSDGSRAHLVAHRQAASRERCVTLASPAGKVTIDFLARIVSHDRDGDLTLSAVHPDLAGDTLLSETHAFLEAIRGERSVAVDGAAGRRALALALAVEAACAIQD